MKQWNKEEIKYITSQYPLVGKIACMKNLNRTEASIRGKASGLKLKQNKNSDFFKDWQNRAKLSKIGKKRPDQAIVMKRLIISGKIKPMTSEFAKKLFKNRWKNKKHPQGMLGKHHTKENREKAIENIRKAWANPNNRVNSKEYRQELSDRMSKMMIDRIRTKGSVYSRTKNGWYKIGKDKFYFRSSWEVVYARYLEFLKEKREIQKWEYEPKTFWFEKIRRGVRSYTPDFKVFFNNGNTEYHEVKGWFDNKSKTKMKRMSIYYPEIKMVLIDKEIYNNILKFERMYPNAVLEIDKKGVD